MEGSASSETEQLPEMPVRLLRTRRKALQNGNFGELLLFYCIGKIEYFDYAIRKKKDIINRP